MYYSILSLDVNKLSASRPLISNLVTTYALIQRTVENYGTKHHSKHINVSNNMCSQNRTVYNKHIQIDTFQNLLLLTEACGI
jgi:hypothetical protein